MNGGRRTNQLMNLVVVDRLTTTYVSWYVKLSMKKGERPRRLITIRQEKVALALFEEAHIRARKNFYTPVFKVMKQAAV